MDFHSINIKTGEISEEVVLTVDDNLLKDIGMRSKDPKDTGEQLK